MPGAKTAYLSQKMLDHALGGTTFTRPATLYWALSNSAFDPNATGAAMDEVAAAGYARVSMANNATNWSTATAGSPSEKHNLVAVSFLTATADWGQPLSAYLADALTGGNLLYGSDITNPQFVNTGDQAKIAATAFSVNES